MSSFTVNCFCAFYPADVSKSCIGSKEEIVNSFFSWELTKQRKLVAQFKGRGERDYHSYQSNWTKDEMRKDAIQTLFNDLPIYGVRLFKDIGF